MQDPVSLVDLAPTLLARAGARVVSGLDGIDLLDPAARAKRRFVLADTWRYDARGRIALDRTAATGLAHRVVYESTTNTLESFSRGSDRPRVPAPRELEHALFEYLEVGGPRPDELE